MKKINKLILSAVLVPVALGIGSSIYRNHVLDEIKRQKIENFANTNYNLAGLTVLLSAGYSLTKKGINFLAKDMPFDEDTKFSDLEKTADSENSGMRKDTMYD